MTLKYCNNSKLENFENVVQINLSSKPIAHHANMVKPWLIFWQGMIKPKYPWLDQTSLICHVTKKVHCQFNKLMSGFNVSVLY